MINKEINNIIEKTINELEKKQNLYFSLSFEKVPNHYLDVEEELKNLIDIEELITEIENKLIEYFKNVSKDELKEVILNFNDEDKQDIISSIIAEEMERQYEDNLLENFDEEF